MKGKVHRLSRGKLVMAVRISRDTYSAVWLDDVLPEVVSELHLNDEVELSDAAGPGGVRHVRRDTSFDAIDVQHGLSRSAVEKVLSPFRRPATGGEQLPT